MDITIERECKGVIGPQTVYPYDIVDYKTNVKGNFSLSDNRIAKIIEEKDTSCTVEITTGKTGDFELIFEPTDFDTTIKYPIHIGSL